MNKNINDLYFEKAFTIILKEIDIYAMQPMLFERALKLKVV